MFSYNKLIVYKKAFLVNQTIYRLLKSDARIPSYIKNQFGRAALSIMLNIAEGSAKFSNKDRKNFFIIARASIFECCSIIEFLESEKEIATNQKDSLLISLEEISRILYKMIRNLE